MNSQLEKAINLVKRTGDKIIVVGENDDSALTIMSLSDYERLVQAEPQKDPENIDIKSLTEEELLDKINRDIVMWQEKNKEDEIEELGGDFASVKEEQEDEQEDENLYYYEEDNDNDGELMEEVPVAMPKKENKNNWQISSDIKNRAEEIK